MSNLETDPRESACGGLADVAAEPVEELLTGRDVVLGGPRAMRVTRTLPNRDVRMVGAWCFVDHYGPERATMRVPPHPHTGLQTVSWLLEGEIMHRDSLGTEQTITPGGLNLMTAGRGVSHSEESAADAPLHGVQLWVALPSHARGIAPAFEHHAALPRPASPGVVTTVIMGELDGVASPATVHTPLVGAEIRLEAGAGTRLTLRPGFEYAVLVLSGAVRVGGTGLSPGPLLYLGSGRSELELRAEEGGRVLLLGGEPFEEHIVMWWNFVGRDHEEIAGFRREWMEGETFGTVPGTVPGARPGAAPGTVPGTVPGAGMTPLPAPELPLTPLKARGRRRR